MTLDQELNNGEIVNLSVQLNVRYFTVCVVDVRSIVGNIDTS